MKSLSAKAVATNVKILQMQLRSALRSKNIKVSKLDLPNLTADFSMATIKGPTPLRLSYDEKTGLWSLYDKAGKRVGKGDGAANAMFKYQEKYEVHAGAVTNKVELLTNKLPATFSELQDSLEDEAVQIKLNKTKVEVEAINDTSDGSTYVSFQSSKLGKYILDLVEIKSSKAYASAVGAKGRGFALAMTPASNSFYHGGPAQLLEVGDYKALLLRINAFVIGQEKLPRFSALDPWANEMGAIAKSVLADVSPNEYSSQDGVWMPVKKAKAMIAAFKKAGYEPYEQLADYFVVESKNDEDLGMVFDFREETQHAVNERGMAVVNFYDNNA